MDLFIQFSELVSGLTKKEIDLGNLDEGLGYLCSLIRVAFFWSNKFRKNRTLWLYLTKDKKLLRLVGSELRYLGPDERSILLLLTKALGVNKTRSSGSRIKAPRYWRQSTPGIHVIFTRDLKDAISRCMNEIKIKKVLFIKVEKTNERAREYKETNKIYLDKNLLRLLREGGLIIFESDSLSFNRNKDLLTINIDENQERVHELNIKAPFSIKNNVDMFILLNMITDHLL
ncbi:MAG: hypothetical protein ACTSVI_09560 [Promethearchaeota archaeon]